MVIRPHWMEITLKQYKKETNQPVPSIAFTEDATASTKPAIRQVKLQQKHVLDGYNGEKAESYMNCFTDVLLF
jgi:hypothetical protein